MSESRNIFQSNYGLTRRLITIWLLTQRLLTRKLIILIFVFIFLCSGKSMSQCGCLGGAAVGGLTPIGGTANVGLLREGFLRTSLFYSFAFGNKFYPDDYPEEDKLVNYYESHYTGLVIGYGLSEDFTIESEIGYFPKKLQDYKTEPLESSGFSHVALSGKYKIFSSLVNEMEATVGAGVKIPLSTKTDNLPQHINASTGAYGISFQAFLHKGFKKQGWHLFLINRTDLNFTNENEYKYGNSYNTSFYITKGLNESFTAMLEFRNEMRSKDKIKGQINYNSGGMFFHIAPQLNYSFSSFNISALFNYPFYQQYYGYQLGNNYSIAINLTWLTNI